MLFGIAVSMVPVSSIIIWITAKPFAKQYRKYTAENANVDSYLVETMNGGTTIKALNASEYAFAECTGLTSIEIPSTVNIIESTSFDGCKNLACTVKEGSYAKEYCEKNNIKYIIAE